MATKVPNVGMPSTAPSITKDWIPGSGETVTHEWPVGTASEVEALYEEKKPKPRLATTRSNSRLRPATGGPRLWRGSGGRPMRTRDTARK